MISDILTRLRGHAIYHKAVTALFTGLRRGELLALRWVNVDLDGKIIAVREVLQETKEGARVKDTLKTKAGRRDVSLPDIVLDVLRQVRRDQLEQRLALGLGRLPDDALVFPAREGGPSRSNQPVERMGGCGGGHRLAGRDVPRPAPHSREHVDRRRARRG